MSSKPVPFTATILLTAAGSLCLSGCGGGTISTTQAPTTSASADSTTLPANDEVTTNPRQPQSQCCWSRWGNHYHCGNYPEGGSGGICNNDANTTCGEDPDCSDIAPPSTTPPPATTTRTMPTTPTTTTTTLPEGACVKTPWSGCLNGQSFVMAERFACGRGANIGIHKWGESSCCAQGRTYDPHDYFCCNNVLNLHSDGQCREYDPNDDPAGCRCPVHSTFVNATEVAEVTEVLAGAEETVIIDTIDWQNQPEKPCVDVEGVMGCLNGFLFDYNSDTICGQYIVKGDTHGCCPRTDGLKPYNYQTESCCQYGDSAVVRPGAHSCQCRMWPTPNCEDSVFSTVI